MVYYTSDLHLGHKNIIRFCDRPFADVTEMDEVLIANYNKRITNSDTVFILRDLMFRIAQNPEVYLDRLKGKKHLILGNHDKALNVCVEVNHYQPVTFQELLENNMVFRKD